MKKIAVCLLTMILLLSLAACENNNTTPSGLRESSAVSGGEGIAPTDPPASDPDKLGSADTTPAESADGQLPDYWNENDLSGAISNLPRSDAVDIIWNRLNGYWTATQDLFIGFVWQDGIPGIDYGVWESEGIGFGEFTNADRMDEYSAALTFLFPAKEATEMDDARPESTVTVFIDVSGLDQDGKINIKIENHGSGEWYTYAYGGSTAEEVYISIH